MDLLLLISLAFIATVIGYLFGYLFGIFICYVIVKIKEWRTSKKYYMIDDSEENLEPGVEIIRRKKSGKKN